MPCQELVEVVTDYLEGALAEIDRRRFEAHLAECDACRDYLGQMRSTIEAVGHIEAAALSDDTRAGLLQTFRGWHAA
jgi:predicted anti-sigma-YlaC factor YlaD